MKSKLTLIIIIIIIIIITIIIALKGVIRDFFFFFFFFLTICSLRREPSPTRTLKWLGRNRVQITCNTSSDYHVQHVVLRAKWYEGTAQLLRVDTVLGSRLSFGWYVATTHCPF